MIYLHDKRRLILEDPYFNNVDLDFKNHYLYYSNMSEEEFNHFVNNNLHKIFVYNHYFKLEEFRGIDKMLILRNTKSKYVLIRNNSMSFIDFDLNEDIRLPYTEILHQFEYMSIHYCILYNPKTDSYSLFNLTNNKEVDDFSGKQIDFRAIMKSEMNRLVPFYSNGYLGFYDLITGNSTVIFTKFSGILENYRMVNNRTVVINYIDKRYKNKEVVKSMYYDLLNREVIKRFDVATIPENQSKRIINVYNTKEELIDVITCNL